jgi:glycosyltransferase involved in cell wall biosynthesis
VSLFAVVPAYNAGRHLAGVVERLRRSAPADLTGIVVVDDGSADNTAQVAARLAADEPRLQLVRRARNGGYGAAVKDGLAAARAAGATTVACVHADGQYSPEVLGRLRSELEGRGLDLLQGSRIAAGTALAGGMPLYKYVANAGLNLLENLTLGLALTDYHSGYLLYGPRALAGIAFARLSDSFDFDLEVIASARAAGLRVGEAPIPTHYGDEVSHLRPVRYGLRVLRVLWRYRRGHYDAAHAPT